MKALSISQCTHVSGGITPDAILLIGGASLAGGYVGYKTMQFLEPVATTIGVLAGGALGGAGGLVFGGPVAPVAAIACGCLGAMAGYTVTSTLTNMAGGLTGMALGGGAAGFLLFA